MNFENLTIELHVLYFLKMHVKFFYVFNMHINFHSNRVLFTI